MVVIHLPQPGRGGVPPRPPARPHPSTPGAQLGTLGAGAECVYDPELHTGPGSVHAETATARAAREQVAREVCASCPVLALCLPYALAARPTGGVWAGHTAATLATLATRAA